MSVVNQGAMFIALVKSARLGVFKILSVRNKVEVIIKYRTKLRVLSWGEKGSTTIIHPRWAMDEKARSFRTCVWFRPPQPPMTADKIPRVRKAQAIWGGRVVII